MSELKRNVPEKRPKHSLSTRIAAGALVVGAGLGAHNIYTDIRELSENPIEYGNEDNHFHVVEQGETPWEISRDYWGEDKDIRPLVNGIKEQMEMRGDDFLMPGQVIELPPKDDQ